jgi:hypothetical protein
MPLNLSEYTPRIRESLKRGGFACVYVASTPEGKPSRLGYAVNLHQAVATVQHHCPTPVWVEEVLWVPDRSIAGAIAKVTHSAHADRMLHGGWLDVTAGEVAFAMIAVAQRKYPTSTMITHNELIATSREKRHA